MFTTLNVNAQQDSVDIDKLIYHNPIKITPNPFSKGFTFSYDGPQSEYVISMSDGQTVLMGIIDGVTYVDTESWKNGVYVIKVENKQQIILLRR